MDGVHYHADLKSKYKELAQKKEIRKQGRSPSSFYQQATSQPPSPRGKEEPEKELEENLFPNLDDPNSSKGLHQQCLKNSQNLYGI
ncbi:hypothetical protein O181_109101 [Austropuccinia psidii MF-1]|uniref:Uncharacterized protein n=1 Tax=Austropuccinia psidii MF-1 TaxID=1389203 RepID=A0A9Q3JW23_9BASI|nr:hypothetical protein [Austropuccinia psidii MF-1]